MQESADGYSGPRNTLNDALRVSAGDKWLNKAFARMIEHRFPDKGREEDLLAPFVYRWLTEHHWINEKQFVDAMAAAMITPGPMVITVGFIGYLMAGFPDACVTAIGTFFALPSIPVNPASYFNKYRKLPAIVAFVDGTTATAVGAITGSVIVIARRSIVDIPTTLMSLVTIAILWEYKKLQGPLIMLAAALLELVLYPFVPCFLWDKCVKPSEKSIKLNT